MEGRRPAEVVGGERREEETREEERRERGIWKEKRC
jgi:hypothetical protein